MPNSGLVCRRPVVYGCANAWLLSGFHNHAIPEEHKKRLFGNACLSGIRDRAPIQHGALSLQRKHAATLWHQLVLKAKGIENG